MCTCVQNRKWRLSQWTANTECCEWLSDQGEFEAIKTLSGWEAAHCDQQQFRAKIKVNT